MNSRNQPWTAAEDQHLRDHWQRADLTIEQIGAMIGRGKDGVKHRAAVQLNLGHRPGYDPWEEGVFSEVARLYAAGVGCSEIARRFGMTRNQVTSKLSRKGLIRRASASPPSDRPVKPRGIPRKGKARLEAVKQQAASLIPEKGPTREGHASATAIIRRVEAVKPPQIIEPFRPVEGSSPRPWTERATDECNWPVGDGLSCCEPVHAAGWCQGHYAMGRVPLTPKQRQLARSIRRWVA